MQNHMFDINAIMDSVKESFRKEREEKANLYKPLDRDILEYLHTKFFTCGRMISGTKNVPDWQDCVFNANVCTKTHGKIWFGDLRLTTDGEKLHDLATKVGETIYVLREFDARFENEVRPLFEKAVASYKPDIG